MPTGPAFEGWSPVLEQRVPKSCWLFKAGELGLQHCCQAHTKPPSFPLTSSLYPGTALGPKTDTSPLQWECPRTHAPGCHEGTRERGPPRPLLRALLSSQAPWPPPLRSPGAHLLAEQAEHPPAGPKATTQPRPEAVHMTDPSVKGRSLNTPQSLS